MINLLPPHTRKDLLYARKNTALLKWAFALNFVLLGVFILLTIGYIYINQTTKTYTKRAAQTNSYLQSQNIDQTQKDLDAISGNIKLATDVLSREILFSKLLKQMGAALPSNTSLQTLQIDNVKGGITLSAGSSNFDSGAQIQLNLQDPKNQIFEKADIENINCDTTNTAKKYPCIVQIRALFMKNNPFLYISPTKKGATQ